MASDNVYRVKRDCSIAFNLDVGAVSANKFEAASFKEKQRGSPWFMEIFIDNLLKDLCWSAYLELLDSMSWLIYIKAYVGIILELAVWWIKLNVQGFTT